MNRVLPFIKWISISLGSVFLILFLALIMVGFGYQERVYPRISVAQIPIGNTSIREARAILEQESNTLEQVPFTLTSDASNQEFSLQDLGIELTYDATLVEAFRLKRNEPLRGLLSLFRSDTLDWNYTIDQNILISSIQKDFIDPLSESRNASLAYANGSVEIIQETAGQTIESDPLVQEILQSLEIGITTIQVPVTSKTPEVTKEGLEAFIPQIQETVRDHTIFFEDQEWIVSPQEIVRWIQLENGSLALNQSLAEEYITTLSDDIARDPRNAKVQFNPVTQEIEIIQAGRKGTELLISESSRRLSENVLNQKRMTELFVSIEDPDIYEGNLDSLGIQTLLGRGESDYVGSSSSREANIKVAANKISGTLIAPGEEFSFVEILGPVNAATGYFPELVIKGDRTIPEYGGGVCQVSTTLFRAALDSSLEITERRAHSYVVQYYGTPGLDATIYVPKPDFRFKNTTNNHILLQHSIVGTTLSYEIYGTDTGKESKIIGPTILESNPDGSMKTVAYREIYQNGQLLTKDSFYSNYRPPNKVNVNPLE